MFKPGDKVRCVGDGVYKGSHQPTGLVKGRIYTVKQVIGATSYPRVTLVERPDKPALRADRFVLAKGSNRRLLCTL